MASTLKQALGNPQNQPDMNAMFESFKKNPMEFLTRARLNIPEGMSGNPQAIVQHLMQTGQVPRQLMPRVQQMFRR